MDRPHTEKKRRIVITGAAGLVGQNLSALLSPRNEFHVVGIDKHKENLNALAGRCPTVEVIHADLAEPGDWEAHIREAEVVVQLHMQAKGTGPEPFERNNIRATEQVLKQMKRAESPFLIHVSSASVHSAAKDYYSKTKIRQEAMVRRSPIPHCVLRPTLMYGRHDPKHLGWLARFMARAPLFPIPGDGRFVRQPLYVMDFCRIIQVCIDRRPKNEIYDLTGHEQIHYIDIIRTIRRVSKLRTPIVHLPIPVFRGLLECAALVLKDPPFTAAQLTAITVGDLFKGQDMKQLFGVTPTPFERGILETFAATDGQSR